MRALRRGLIVLFVLAVLFVAADRLAVHLAEDEAAARIKNGKDVPSTAHTEVHIKGFPFLTQVAAKELEQIDAEMSGMKPGGSDLTVRRVDAQLKDVRIGGNYDSAVADEATGSALVSYEDLTRVSEKGVDVAWGGKDDEGKGRVKVTAGVTLLGKTFRRSVTSTISVSGGDTVKLRADKVPGGDIPGLEDAIRKRIDFDRKIVGLPTGMKLERVEATEKGIKMAVHGRGVELAE
jgi:hypothetical protein